MPRVIDDRVHCGVMTAADATAGVDRRPFWAALPAFAGLAALAIATHRLADREPFFDFYWTLTAATIGLWAGLSLMALWQRGGDRRIRLFAATALAVSLTTAMPEIDRHWPAWLIVITLAGYGIAFFGNVPIVVHLASEIPGNHPFTARHPAFILSNYAAGALLAIGTAIVLGVAAFGDVTTAALRRIDETVTLVNRAYYLYAGVISLWLLFTAGRVERLAYRRRQAFIVLIAIGIWTAQNIVGALMPGAADSPLFTNVIEPIAVLVPAMALAIAVFGYHLLDIGSLLRKGVVYGVSVAGLFLLLYLVVVRGAGLIESATGVPMTPVVTIAAFIAVALLFDPMSRWLSSGVDRAFFPEKIALQRLHRSLTADLSGKTTVEGIGERLTERLAAALGASSVALLVVDDDRATFRVRAIAGDIPAESRARSLVCAVDGPVPRELPCETHLRVDFGGEPLALICMGPLRSGAALDADDRELLTQVAQQLAAMIENARLFEVARTDPLTGLARRHIFDDRLRQETARSARTGRPFAVAMADIDHFKRINDRYGHRVGDRVLHGVAVLLAASCRSLDLVARYGGEEFVLLLPETDATSARVVADKLRKAVEDAAFDLNGTPLRVTISIGVAGTGETTLAGDIVSAADAALYAAKRAGRNQVR